MKKVFALLFIAVISTTFFIQAEPAEAQPVLTRKCCDGYGVVRCILENWTPVGNSCVCYQQGWGYAC